MKILWHQNPFKTKVRLDERDKKLLLLAIKVERYEDTLCHIYFNIGRGNLTLEQVQEEASIWQNICDMPLDSEEVVKHIDWLDEEHLGDCVCVACTCSRCYVENLLGIDTLEGLGKHSARMIQGAFSNETTIDEALLCLQEPVRKEKPESWKHHTQEEYEVHIPRWEKQREQAIRWLKSYKEKYQQKFVG